jgi:hypothetical protein
MTSATKLRTVEVINSLREWTRDLTGIRPVIKFRFQHPDRFRYAFLQKDSSHNIEPDIGQEGVHLSASDEQVLK